MEWARNGEGHESDLDWLLGFLQKEIQRRERSQTFQETSTDVKMVTAMERCERVSTAAALHTSCENSLCQLCNKPHATEQCWKLTKLTVSELKEKIRVLGLCFCCLCKGHISRGCIAMCTKCCGRHHVLLCETKGEGKKTETVVPSRERSQSIVQNSESVSACTGHEQVSLNCTGISSVVKPQVMLQTAWVTVRGRKGTVKAVVLFDTGSDRSYVSSRLVQRVDPEWVCSEPVSYVAFGSSKPGPGKMRNVYEINMQGSQGGVMVQ